MVGRLQLFIDLCDLFPQLRDLSVLLVLVVDLRLFLQGTVLSLLLQERANPEYQSGHCEYKQSD
jgi:hypothetical protein